MELMNNILVSIIIPVYNTQNELSKCIESCINQSYKNIEIILINDGSTDESFKICNKYKSIDERIILINKKNEGVSKARNIGIEIAVGEKIIFLDSDDYLKNNYIEEFLKYNKYDLVVCGYEMISGKNKIKLFELKENNFENKEEILKRVALKEEYNFFVGPVLKLFDSKIIKKYNIKFNEKMNYGEDTCFVYEYLEKINNMKYINKSGYCNVIRQGSLSRKKINDIWKEMKYVCESTINLYENKEEKLKNELSNLLFRSIKVVILNSINYNIKKEEFLNLCEEIIKSKYFFKIDKNSFVNNYINKFIYVLLINKKFNLLFIFAKMKSIRK